MQSVAENASDISSCDCPPSCHQVAYDATVSGSMLSDMFIHTLLKRSFGPDIREHFLDALDVHSRVETESMMTMLQQLTRLGRTHEAISNVIDVDVLNPTTSTVGDVYNAVDRIVQRTHDSVEHFRTNLLQPFTNAYEKKVDFFVQRIVNQANAFLAHYASSSDIRPFTDADVHNSSQTFCESYVKFWKWFKDDYDDPFKASTYFDRKMCDRWLYDTCEKFPEFTTEEENKISEQTKVWLKCMMEFREFLDDADSWLKIQATLNSSLPLRAASDDAILIKLKNNTDRLTRTTDSFRLHHVTKVRANANQSCVVLSTTFVHSSDWPVCDSVIHSCKITTTLLRYYVTSCI